ncbi:MAG: serine O-acetyltransferase [Fibrobacter sp.]|nr:serine O-acetyltransferase [Fibrobacter sp.]
METTSSQLWQRIIEEATAKLAEEPFALFLKELILDRKDFCEALAAVLAARLGHGLMDHKQLFKVFKDELSCHPEVVEQAACDLEAVYQRDPAVNLYLEAFLFFKGFLALQTHRIAHELWKHKRNFAALMLQSLVSQQFDVDIHPAAKIGKAILMDHATNLVVGETAEIGDFVSILHGVTLGGTGKEKGDRHPKVCDGVMIGAHAQLLGNIRIGKGAKIGAGAVVLSDVPPRTTVAGVPATIIGAPLADMPALEMQQDFTVDSRNQSNKG